jgi:hypothetical protein
MKLLLLAAAETSAMSSTLAQIISLVIERFPSWPLWRRALILLVLVAFVYMTYCALRIAHLGVQGAPMTVALRPQSWLSCVAQLKLSEAHDAQESTTDRCSGAGIHRDAGSVAANCYSYWALLVCSHNQRP